MGVKNANTKLYTSFWRTSRTIPTCSSKNLFHNLLFRMNRESTTSILSRNNKVCNGTSESVKTVISLHCVTPLFFHVKCKQPTTAKMHKIFIAQKSYCACRVLSLATIRSIYYFNFILNRTRSGRELFGRPSYCDIDCSRLVMCCISFYLDWVKWCVAMQDLEAMSEEVARLSAEKALTVWCRLRMYRSFPICRTLNICTCTFKMYE